MQALNLELSPCTTTRPAAAMYAFHRVRRYRRRQAQLASCCPGAAQRHNNRDVHLVSGALNGHSHVGPSEMVHPSCRQDQDGSSAQNDSRQNSAAMSVAPSSQSLKSTLLTSQKPHKGKTKAVGALMVSRTSRSCIVQGTLKKRSKRLCRNNTNYRVRLRRFTTNHPPRYSRCTA